MNLESIEMRILIKLRVYQEAITTAIKEKEEAVHIKDFYESEIKTYKRIVRELDDLLTDKN